MIIKLDRQKIFNYFIIKMVIKMFKINKINDEVYNFNDEDMCSVYLIIGEDKALVIDTGMPSKDSLLKEIRKITDKELIVVLTHGHFDHVGHLDEFSSFYISKEDLECFENKNISYDKDKLHLLKDQQIFDLKNIQVKAIKTPGHTKGSYTFIDEKHHILFTGDQFGSGCGVWMQVLEALPLSEYIKSIDNFLNYLNENYNYNVDDWSYYPGHLGQEYTGKLGYNPLNTNMVRNLKELSVKLLANKIDLLPSKALSFNNEKSYYVSYKNAEMVIRKSLIK